MALSWSGLAVGQRYLGSVSYLNGGAVAGTTIVEVDTTDPLPLFRNAGSKQANAR